MLAQMNEPNDSPRMKAALAWLEKEQEPEGSWFGRWGVNYIYGTWSVLCALGRAGSMMPIRWWRARWPG
jgi:squalene-hopene/tetraprenyl-beta-curcumene cyclase